ncbi:hypothetical protein [Actinomadura sp. NEAU-AAG7]|uniref:hypothetical protein n=1 Tax=Actinomadura sp. NEAU-AAG7 TaxID=2839640 RepID=UPI001BE41489|nr:hypothetical protein [Actinomadura sp. NEAU-AAG7]MBT2209786.1 hypothetical protein [Actinomadura sp. NEAU-AAG7]
MSTGTAYAQDSAARADGTRVTAPTHQTTGLNSGNDNASVDGVGQCAINQSKDCWAWIDKQNGTPCPSGHFCIYTNVWANEGGKVFSLYRCRDFTLRRWNGEGLYHNSNTGGAHGYLKGSGRNVLKDVAPGESGPYDFGPVYYVRAC